MEGAIASMKASTASTPLLLHHRYMVAFPTPARAATPSIDIWWKPTVLRSSYVASRIALRDTSLRLRPCAAAVDGAAANGDTPGHFETSRFTTRGIFRKPCGVARRRSLRRCIFPLTAAVQMTCSPWIRRGLSGFARCCGPPLRGRPSVRPSRRHAPAVPKIGRASGVCRLAPRALQPDCAAVGAVDGPHGPLRSCSGPRSP